MLLLHRFAAAAEHGPLNLDDKLVNQECHLPDSLGTPLWTGKTVYPSPFYIYPPKKTNLKGSLLKL